MNRFILAVVVLAGIHVCGSSGALAQDFPTPSTNTLAKNADDLADQQMALMRKRIESVRKQLVASNLALTDADATRFWPVYDQYSGELNKITETKTALIKEYGDAYGSLTDEQADSLVSRWLDTDIAALELHRKYLPIFRKVLGGKVTATFFQVEQRINMMIDLQLTSQLPLVQSQDVSPASFSPAVEQ
jgi:outer membrane murein-binding lipoprotein Lpp